MGIKKVPESFEHVCDGCKTLERSVYKTRPIYWSELVLHRDAYDFQGAAVADGTVRRYLCSICTAKVTEAINKAVGGA